MALSHTDIHVLQCLPKMKSFNVMETVRSVNWSRTHITEIPSQRRILLCFSVHHVLNCRCSNSHYHPSTPLQYGTVFGWPKKKWWWAGRHNFLLCCCRFECSICSLCLDVATDVCVVFTHPDAICDEFWKNEEMFECSVSPFDVWWWRCRGSCLMCLTHWPLRLYVLVKNELVGW